MRDPLSFELIRSRRRTLSLSVTPNGVRVCAPVWMEEAAVRRFVESKESWIRKKLEESARLRNRFSRVCAEETILDAGAEKRLVLGAYRNGEWGDCIAVRNVRSLQRFFMETRGDVLVEALHELSLRCGLIPSDVQVRDFKARWGSCDSHGLIKLNWRLAMLPVPLRDYVIVHELCHLSELNHSRAFWREVGRCCPQYRALRRELKDYSFLTAMYRGEKRGGQE